MEAIVYYSHYYLKYLRPPLLPQVVEAAGPETSSTACRGAFTATSITRQTCSPQCINCKKYAYLLNNHCNDESGVFIFIILFIQDNSTANRNLDRTKYQPVWPACYCIRKPNFSGQASIL